MARIRTIKPEFFTDPDVAKLDPRARLLYIAMWCAADDFGVGETNINSLLGLAFPDSDEVSAPLLRRFCADIAQHLRVTFYEVRGRHYYAIPTWEKHQKLERRSDRRKHPAPDDSDATPDLRILPPPESAPELRRENGAESCEILPEQGKGNRGKGTGESTSRPPLQTELTTPAPRPPRKTGTDIVLDNVRALNTQTSRHAEAAAIVTEFGAWLGTPLDAKTATETTAIVESCLIAGQTRDEIAAGMVLWSPSDSWSPSQIPKFITKAAARRKHRGVGKPTEKAITVAELAAELIAEMETTE